MVHAFEKQLRHGISYEIVFYPDKKRKKKEETEKILKGRRDMEKTPLPIFLLEFGIRRREKKSRPLKF